MLSLFFFPIQSEAYATRAPFKAPHARKTIGLRPFSDSKPGHFLFSSRLLSKKLPEFEGDNHVPAFAFNPLYATLWAAFLGFGFFLSPGTMLDPNDTSLIRSFLDDPTNSQRDVNPLFFIVFNALGIMPLVMAQLTVPQGRRKGLWAAPFLLGSMAAGYGALGLYLSFRAPPADAKTGTEISWITRNLLENKIFNWITVALCGSVLLTSGILSNCSVANLDSMSSDYLQLASGSKLVSVSSVDLLILTISAATLIPRDYCLRSRDVIKEDDAKINLLAASTVFLPVVGAALYCALRPPLPEE
jgi:hypothetical protein